MVAAFSLLHFLMITTFRWLHYVINFVFILLLCAWVYLPWWPCIIHVWLSGLECWPWKPETTGSGLAQGSSAFLKLAVCLECLHLPCFALICVHVHLYVHYSTDSSKLDIRHPAHFDHQGAQVWRVAWNVTGTILASSGDDGCIRLWKGVYMKVQAYSTLAT